MLWYISAIKHSKFLLIIVQHKHTQTCTHVCLLSCPMPSVFLVMFSLIAWFNRRHNDASRPGWPMIMQWIVEDLNQFTNWELECEPKTFIMAGWMYRWGQQHGIQLWNGHHIASVLVCLRRRRGWYVSYIVDVHWPRPTAGSPKEL